MHTLQPQQRESFIVIVNNTQTEQSSHFQHPVAFTNAYLICKFKIFTQGGQVFKLQFHYRRSW